jgi:hypothetical protein
MGTLAIVKLVKHRVKEGDTLDTIATSYDVNKEDIASFEWGAKSTAEISAALNDFVGSSKKSADGRQYILDDSDYPGVIHVPTPLKLGGLLTRRTYQILVRRQKLVALILETKDGLRVPGAHYEVHWKDGATQRGRLGPAGNDVFINPHEGEFEVHYPKPDQIKAYALAAAVSAGFLKHDTAPLFALLSHPPKIVTGAVRCYDKYCCKTKSQKFETDLYQEVTDPDALLVAESYLRKAGVKVRAPLSIRDLGDNDTSGDRSDGDTDTATDYHISASPDLGGAAKGQTVTYGASAANETPTPDYFRWWSLPDATTAKRYGDHKIVKGPKTKTWPLKWNRKPGTYLVFCNVQSNDQSLNDVLIFTQQVLTEQSVVPRMTEKGLASGRLSPDAMLRAVAAYCDLVEKLGKEFTFEDDDAKTEHQEQVKEMQAYGHALKARLKGTEGKVRLPFAATHVADDNLHRLHVFATPIVESGEEKEWAIVDWTDPLDGYASEVYKGKGKSATAALAEAVNIWAKAAQYPEGTVYAELSHPAFSTEFNTRGKSRWEKEDRAFPWIASQDGDIMVPGTVTLLKPIPNAGLVSGLIWTRIFSNKLSATINIAQQHAPDYEERRQDSLDALTVIDKLLATVSATSESSDGSTEEEAWQEGAQILVPPDPTKSDDDHDTLFTFVGDATKTGIEGVLLETSKMLGLFTILKNSELKPATQINMALDYMRSEMRTAYINLHPTQRDQATLQDENLEALKRPRKLFDILQIPSSMGDTKKGNAPKANEGQKKPAVNEEKMAVRHKAEIDVIPIEGVATGTKSSDVKKVLYDFCVRIDISPEDAEETNDKFRLFSTNGEYEQTKTVKDDMVKGDDYVDLEFSEIERSWAYSLEITSDEAEDPEFLFENVSYDELNDLSPNANDDAGDDDNSQSDDEPWDDEPWDDDDESLPDDDDDDEDDENDDS